MKSLAFLLLLSCVSLTVTAQIDTIQFNSTLSVPALNWPNGTWYMRAILISDTDSEVTPITDQINFNLTNQAPFILVTMAVGAPDTYKIRFYRSQSPFQVGDTNIEFNDVNCGSGNCDLPDPASIFLSNTLNTSWMMQTVVPVELQSFTIEE